VLAAIAVVVNSDVPFNASVKVPADAAVLVTTMLVTTVVVDAGTVYRVVLDVAAAALARALLTVAISYYFLLVILGIPDNLNLLGP
jgi:hypothetical protein